MKTGTRRNIDKNATGRKAKSSGAEVESKRTAARKVFGPPGKARRLEREPAIRESAIHLKDSSKYASLCNVCVLRS